MNENEYKILEKLRESDSVFFRELSRKSGVSIGGTQKVLKKYSQYIKKEVEGRNVYYSLKKDMKTDYLRKILEYEKTRRFLEKNSKFSEFFRGLSDKGVVSCVFGSYVRGEEGEGSDLDLLVLSKKKIPEHLCPVEIHLIKMGEKQFEKALKNKEGLIKEIKKNRLIIYGVDYFVNLFKKKNE